MTGIADDDIRWLLDLLERENLAEIEVHEGGQEVVVRAALAGDPTSVAAPAAPPAETMLPENHLPVLSPMAGVFYRASTPGAPPFVEAGDRVEFGDTVGLIEAMKLFNEIPSPAAGTVVRFLVRNEQQVEADQPLLILEVQGPH